MKSVTHSTAQVFAAGFIVLLFISLLLFWIRFLCETSLSERMPGEAQGVGIRPSGLVPSELEEDPNVVYHSFVGAELNHHSIMHIGVIGYLTTRFPEGRHSNVYFIKSDQEYTYLDKKSGQIVYRDIHSQIMPDKSAQLRLVHLYAGPEGISEIPNQTLGRFIDPIIDRSQLFQAKEKSVIHELIVYDKNLRCFFRMDFDQKTITKGPDVDNTGPVHKPIQIGWLWKNDFSTRINWKPPQIQDSNENDNKPDFRGRRPIIPSAGHIDAGPYLLVLDESGRIDLLDKQTLEFAGTAGRLPGPETYFGKKPSVTPKDLTGYIVQPLVLNKFYRDDGKMFKRTFGSLDDSERRIASKIDREYLGMFATGVSRSGTAMALAVFNAEGQRIKSGYTRSPLNEGRSYLQSSKATFWETPWAPALTLGKFLAENLHPPILSLASYFAASAFEAGAGHRALFLLPNSFVAMIGRDGPGNRAERYATALWWMMPSIILAIWLASRIGKNAVMTGLSQKTRRRWIIGTMAFGLPAYITYRLTRPKITLVTCANCGKPRRPDMEKCHQCGSLWHVPELTPPTWRVLDNDTVQRDQEIRKDKSGEPDHLIP
ncbi:hypothetical protein ACFL5Z_00175 [Planctomycetota bacterium]